MAEVVLFGGDGSALRLLPVPGRRCFEVLPLAMALSLLPSHRSPHKRQHAAHRSRSPPASTRGAWQRDSLEWPPTGLWRLTQQGPPDRPPLSGADEDPPAVVVSYELV